MALFVFLLICTDRVDKADVKVANEGTDDDVANSSGLPLLLHICKLLHLMV